METLDELLGSWPMELVRQAYGVMVEQYIELFGSSAQVHSDDLAVSPGIYRSGPVSCSTLAAAGGLHLGRAPAAARRRGTRSSASCGHRGDRTLTHPEMRICHSHCIC